MKLNKGIPTIHFDFSNLGTESLLEVIRTLKNFKKEYEYMTVSEIKKDIQEEFNKQTKESYENFN
jgi:ribosome recycling factor